MKNVVSRSSFGKKAKLRRSFHITIDDTCIHYLLNTWKITQKVYSAQLRFQGTNTHNTSLVHASLNYTMPSRPCLIDVTDCKICVTLYQRQHKRPNILLMIFKNLYDPVKKKFEVFLGIQRLTFILQNSEKVLRKIFLVLWLHNTYSL